ncbi:3120_t:CDS:2 [Cetraspora pellucida]|uniref:3120_t:CDS:1 n=1 Tax=Cetraspora pellucida TaxID=1433469 RepID=A0ACA9MRY2_9GLOM|nr:3120_t:CDS:2 [Cetraspora pellucida]
METDPEAHKSTLVRTIHETDIIDSSEATSSKDIDVETDNSNVKKRKLSDQSDKEEFNRQISKQIVKKSNSDDVVCYYENGLRKVTPYYYEHRTFAKGRWLGRKILDIFSTEFRDRSREYYTYAIEEGLITINTKKVTPETIVKNQDLIGHRLHRHEPPVTADPIKILCVEDDYIVINKPSSIPVHPSGRLDRLTSGIMILSSKKEKAREFEQQMKNHKIQKEYIGRVLGEFPEEKITCDKPIKIVSHKLGLNVVHEYGKPCTTIFERVSYNGRTSIVKCKPITGRTHQIRVHLQYLGHPIANDPLYANAKAWGSKLGKGGIDAEQTDIIIDKLIKEGFCDDGDMSVDSQKKTDDSQTDTGDDLKNEIAKLQNENNHAKESIVTVKPNIEVCVECTAPKFSDPFLHQLLIWLHALKYEGDGWKFESELPFWAKDDFVGDMEYA